MKRLMSGIAAGVLLGLLVAAPAAAGDYPPEVFGEFSVSDSTVVCGDESITVSGEGWLPGEPVEIQFDGSTIETVTPNNQGDFEATVSIPSASEGDHKLTAVQAGGEQRGEIAASATVTCVLGTQAGLATTGANISVWLAIVAGLFVAGGAALFAGRRRKVEAS